RTLEDVDSIPGKPIQLTIDYDLQAVAEADMADKEGAVVAMDAHTGEILAMVSKPTFDPNDFAVRIPQDEWQKLNTDKHTPLLNRAIQAQLAPGSVFKIVMATAMVDSNFIAGGRRAMARWNCTGPSWIPATSSSTTLARCWA